MPYVNIRITKEGPSGAGAEKKAQLIKGATQLLVVVLQKNPVQRSRYRQIDTDNGESAEKPSLQGAKPANNRKEVTLRLFFFGFDCPQTRFDP